MKKVIFSLALLLTSSLLGFAQKGISYQAIILDPKPIEIPGQDITGQPFVNGQVSLKFKLFSSTFVQEFEEVHATQTDAYGMVNVLIGSQNAAAFSALVWDLNPRNMQVWVSFDQGGNYTKVSEQVLTYTPYALYAETTGTAGKLSGTLTISEGGTGAKTAENARINLGLGNVDNTSDANKPVSIATQNALDAKANALTTYVNNQIAAIPDADAATKGKIQLAGDLAGTAAAPTVPGLVLKADAAAVNAALNLKANEVDVANSLALKADATAVNAALNQKANAIDVTNELALKANSAEMRTLLREKEILDNKSINVLADAGSDSKYPTVKSIKTYVDAQVAGATIADANASTKGKIQLAGDLAGTAAAPTVPGLALKANTADVTSALALKANTSSLSTVATSGSYNDLSNKPTIPAAYTLPVASASAIGGVKVGANLSIDANGVLSATASNNASSITGTLPVANGGTGTTTIAGIKSLLGLSSSKVAIGDQAGQTSQQNYTIAIGAGAGASNQNSGGIAIGGAAGGTNQGSSSVAIGSNAGQANQSQRTVAVGFAAGQNNQGENAVALGTFAGNNGQAANSIAINATGMNTPLNPTNAGFYVNPIRNASAANSLFYDASTKEITYGTASASGVPYTGATGPVNLGAYNLTVNGLTIGKGAGSNNGVNTAFGASALASNTTGAYNTAIGFQVLTNNTTGNNNHALGFQALAANTSGSRNTAFGEASLPRNTEGSDNVAIGVTALFRNTTANNNIAIGTQALGNSLTGSNNIAIGSQALTGNSTSSNNTAVGYQSLQQTSGSDNTALGRLSLMGNTTGSFNTAVGSLADVNSNNLSNATAIGYGARVLANNTIQLGADGTGFVTNGVNISTTPISNVRTSGSLTAGAVTYPNTNGTAGQVLTATNNGNASWTTIASVADASTMTGTVAIAKGGTGATTATAALTNLGAAPIASPTFTGTLTAPIYASTPQALTDNSTISWDPANGLNASVTLGGNRTLSFSTTPVAGAYGTLVVTQDGTGGRTLTLPSTANKVLGSTSTTTIALSTAAGAKDIINFYYDGTNCYWNVGQGYGTAASGSSTNLSSSVSGTLAVANGGTGATTLTGLVKGSGTSALTAAVAGTDYLAPNGSAAGLTNFPTLNQNTTGTAANVTGIVSVANGGTGVTSSTGTGNVVLSVSPAFTGTPTAPTATSGTNNTQVATTAFVTSALSTSGLPSQSGNSGKFLTTNGTTASWASSSGGVPYSGASGAVNLGNYNLTVYGIKIGTSGTDNFALNNNMVIGRNALVNNNNGYNNLAIGNTALYTNVGGYNNVGIGNESQYQNLWGWGNVSLGVASLNQNVTGNFNTAVGHSAGYFLTSSYNTAFGHNALDGQADGGGNTGVGVNAGGVPWNQRTYNSTFLGYNAKAQSGLDNVIVIGYNAYTNEHHTIQLGDNRIVKLKTSGTIWSNGSQLTSDLRLKTNIQPLPNSLELIMKLNPVHYAKKNSIESTDYSKTENGFIAQELQKVLPYLVNEGTDKDKILSVDYNSIIPVLTKGIQEQQLLINAQQKQIDEMKLILEKLMNEKK
jgi:hypothetical protein